MNTTTAMARYIGTGDVIRHPEHGLVLITGNRWDPDPDEPYVDGKGYPSDSGLMGLRGRPAADEATMDFNGMAEVSLGQFKARTPMELVEERYWPYIDAKQFHPISERYRIPVVSNPYPMWSYHVAICIDSTPEKTGLYAGFEPTDEELAQLAAYRDFWLQKFYNPSYIERMKDRPFDIDGGTVTRIFFKRADNSWHYRQSTWNSGPVTWPGTYVPEGATPPKNHTLVELLDHMNNLSNEKWETFKAERLEIFPVS